jgi:glutathione S-transferase
MDAELSRGEFLVGERASIADVACYTYIAHAPACRGWART